MGMASKEFSNNIKETDSEVEDFVRVTVMEKDKGSQDSLNSDINSIDSLESIVKSMDSLEIKNEDISDSLEDLTCEFEESSLMRSMDQDLENVIAEATKLQTQVLESIIGGNEATDKTEGSNVKKNTTENYLDEYSCMETTKVLEELESQINEHSSEKETFSKGIAAIIYEPIQKESF